MKVEEAGVAMTVVDRTPSRYTVGITSTDEDGASDSVCVYTKRVALEEAYFDTAPYTKFGEFKNVIVLQQIVVATIFVSITAFREFPVPIEVSA